MRCQLSETFSWILRCTHSGTCSKQVCPSGRVRRVRSQSKSRSCQSESGMRRSSSRRGSAKFRAAMTVSRCGGKGCMFPLQECRCSRAFCVLLHHGFESFNRPIEIAIVQLANFRGQELAERRSLQFPDFILAKTDFNFEPFARFRFWKRRQGRRTGTVPVQKDDVMNLGLPSCTDTGQSVGGKFNSELAGSPCRNRPLAEDRKQFNCRLPKTHPLRITDNDSALLLAHNRRGIVREKGPAALRTGECQ